jgi:hypothetical protein
MKTKQKSHAEPSLAFSGGDEVADGKRSVIPSEAEESDWKRVLALGVEADASSEQALALTSRSVRKHADWPHLLSDPSTAVGMTDRQVAPAAAQPDLCRVASAAISDVAYLRRSPTNRQAEPGWRKQQQ